MLPWAIPLFAALANALLGVLVYRHGRQKPLNRLFCLVTATIVAWNLNIFSLYYFEAERAFYWSNVFRTGTLLMPPTVVHLFLLFGERRSLLSRIYILAAYGLAVFLIGANAVHQLVYSVRIYVLGYYPVASPLYILHVISVTVNFAVAAVLMITNVTRAPSPHKRLQASFWLLGTGIGILGGFTNLMPVYNLHIYPIGNIANVPYTAIVAYAIVRHRLMDIDIVVTKGLSYVTVAALLVIPAFLATLALQLWAFGMIRYDFSFAVLVLLFGVGFLFPIFRLRTETQIEQSFFREKFEYRAALRSFAKSIIRILDREALIHELGKGLTDALRLDRIAIFLWNDAVGKFDVRYVGGESPGAESFDADHPLVRYLEARREALLREEVEASAEDGERSRVGEIFAANGWEVCVPLPVTGRLVGFLGLGRKRNLSAFTVVDLDLLDTVAAQAAIAFENARLSEELHKSRDIIQRAGRMSALGALAAGIAHEIRNPLVSIQTFFQLAPERLHDEEFVTSFLGLAENEVKRIGDLVTELLTFARSHDESVQEVDLDDALDRTLRLLSPQANTEQVRLERAATGELPTVRADPDRIKQVLINIVLNAIQATDAGGVVTVTTRQTRRGGREFCQIEVQDTGAGIAPERQEDIFNPFYTTKDKGTGLGLSIAHQIVTEHGGFISVESQQGEGCRFFIHLPVPEAKVGAAREAESDSIGARAVGSSQSR